MLEIQKNEDYKAAPKLKDPCVAPKQYQKMNVGNSINLLSNDVGAGLLIHHKQITGDLNPTAWFCQKTFRWFKLMTSRTISLALSCGNLKEYEDAREFLKEYMWIATKLVFRPGSQSLLPFQKAILLSTQTCLDLSSYLLSIGFKFFMTSRISTDCTENVFSQVRVASRKPSARQFVHSLRLIAVANFVSKIETSNYDYDESDDSFSMIDFLEDKVQNTTKVPELNKSAFKKFKKQVFNLSEVEKNHIYYFSGFILRKIKKMKKFSSCKRCLSNLLISCKSPPRKNSHNKLTILKNFKAQKALLVFPTSICFQYFCQMEKLVKMLKSQSLFLEPGCKEFFIEEMSKVKSGPFASCHGVKERILSLFFNSRRRISLKQRNRNKEQNPKLIY